MLGALLAETFSRGVIFHGLLYPPELTQPVRTTITLKKTTIFEKTYLHISKSPIKRIEQKEKITIALVKQHSVMVNPSEHSSANHFQSGLYLVATPIGNLQDMTFRAVELLKKADLIACEDTRVSGKLFSYFGIKTTLLSYNDHSDELKRDKILKALERGEIVALISDAGMPLISDPGYKLVKRVSEQGFYVTSLPGASAPLMALQLSALPSDKFCFLGFLPSKDKARKDLLNVWKNTPATLIAFDTAPRIQASLMAIQDTLGNREIAIARELTKRFEEIKRGQVSDLIQELEKQEKLKGEIVLVIGPPQNDEQSWTQEKIDDLIRDYLNDHSVRETADKAAELTGEKRKTLYNRALELKNEDQ